MMQAIISRILTIMVLSMIQTIFDRKGCYTYDQQYKCYSEDIEEETIYVSLGHQVLVKNNLTGDEKNFKVDYIKETGEIPGLAKELLGLTLGDKINYEGKSYTIIRIHN